jgi:hypothetical protein
MNKSGTIGTRFTFSPLLYGASCSLIADYITLDLYESVLFFALDILFKENAPITRRINKRDNLILRISILRIMRFKLSEGWMK